MDKERIIRYIYENDKWHSKRIDECRLFLKIIILGKEKYMDKSLDEWIEHFSKYGLGKQSEGEPK